MKWTQYCRCRVEVKHCLPQPRNNILPNAAQDATGLLYQKDILVAFVQFVCLKASSGPFCQATFQLDLLLVYRIPLQMNILLNFLVLNFIWFLSAQFSSLFWSLRIAMSPLTYLLHLCFVWLPAIWKLMWLCLFICMLEMMSRKL